jgi:hypothetical protein
MTKKRVQVSFTEDQWDLIQNMQEDFGTTDAEVVRNIVISWLAEKSFITQKVKNEIDDR